jgi:NADH:ubiquinone oxidoreductase subunit
MGVLKSIFTWWDGATVSTNIFTRRKGSRVGTDEFGNVYYRSRAIDPALGIERRWVIYNGVAEASRIPPGWYGWMHHSVDTPPSETEYTPRDWQKPHLPNLTGTPRAYRPQGSMLASGKRPSATGDYKAWTPGG